MISPSEPIKQIAITWMDALTEQNRQAPQELWMLYDLACGRDFADIGQLVEWVGKLSDKNKSAIIVKEYIDKLCKSVE